MIEDKDIDPYRVLNVAKDATFEQIKRSYHKAVLRCHPDKYPDSKEKEEKKEIFQVITAAYQILCDEETRQRYDDRLKLEELRTSMTTNQPILFDIPSDFPGPRENAPTEYPERPSKDAKPRGRTLESTVQAPLGQVFDLMFGSSSGDFLRAFLIKSQKCSALEMNIPKTGLGSESKQCSYCFVKALNTVDGLKKTTYLVDQYLSSIDLWNNVIVVCSTQMPDLENWRRFVLKTIYCLTWGPENSTKLTMRCFVEWRGQPWLRGVNQFDLGEDQLRLTSALVEFLNACLEASKAKVHDDIQGPNKAIIKPSNFPRSSSPDSPPIERHELGTDSSISGTEDAYSSGIVLSGQEKDRFSQLLILTKDRANTTNGFQCYICPDAMIIYEGSDDLLWHLKMMHPYVPESFIDRGQGQDWNPYGDVSWQPHIEVETTESPKPRRKTLVTGAQYYKDDPFPGSSRRNPFPKPPGLSQTSAEMASPGLREPSTSKFTETIPQLKVGNEVLSSTQVAIDKALLPEVPGRRGLVFQPQPPAKKHEPGILVLKGSLHGTEVHAIPDTGAENNMIHAPFAKELGLNIKPHPLGSMQTFRLPNGKQINTIGQVEALWHFQEETTQACWLTFNVLADSIFDVLMGSPFLRATETMARNRHRLSRIPRPERVIAVRNVNLVGSPSQRIYGTLDDRAVSALPDSGAEPNLVSMEYALKRGWLFDTSPHCRHLLQFADGSVTETEGQVQASWSFEDQVFGKQFYQTTTFSVLRGCVFDVILGQDFIDDSDAFTKHTTCFRDVETRRTDSRGLYHVIWLPRLSKKKQKIADAENQLSSNSTISAASQMDEELQRRAVRDREIRKMVPSSDESVAAIQEETARRNAWDASHGNSVASKGSSTTSIPSVSSSTSQSSKP